MILRSNSSALFSPPSTFIGVLLMIFGGIVTIIIFIFRSIMSNYIYELIKDWLPFVSGYDNSSQIQNTSSEGELQGSIEHRQSQQDQSQSQSADIDVLEGEMEVSQSQTAESGQDEDDEILPDGGFRKDSYRKYASDGGSQQQNQEFEFRDERTINVKINEDQEDDATDLSIKMYPINQSNNGRPILPEARDRQAIPFYQMAGQVQIEIDWPTNLEPQWIYVETPDGYEVRFIEEHQLCEYISEPPRFRLSDMSSKVDFTIEIAADSEPIHHRAHLCTEDGETFVAWELCDSKRFGI